MVDLQSVMSSWGHHFLYQPAQHGLYCPNSPEFIVIFARREGQASDD